MEIEKEIAGKRAIAEKMEEDRRFAGMVKFSGIPVKTHMKMRLFTFLPMKGAEQAYAAALQYVAVEGEPGHESPLREHHFITFVGEPGRGKTHLAIGIGWHWLEVKNELVKYGQVAVLLDDLRSGYNKNSPQEAHEFDMKLNRVKECSLLILDDLGVEQSTPWVREKLDEIIDYRYINELPLVVTTNLKAAQLEPRIARRLREGVRVTLDCEDYSALIAKQRKERKDA